MTVRMAQSELKLHAEPYRYQCVRCGAHQLHRNNREPTVYCNGCGKGSSAVRDKKRDCRIELH